MQKSTKLMIIKSGKEHGFLLIELAVAFTLMVLGISLLTSFYYFCDHTHDSIITYFEKIAVLQTALRCQLWPAPIKHTASLVEMEPVNMSQNYYTALGPQLPSFVEYIPQLKLLKAQIKWEDRTKKKHALELIVGRVL